MSKSPRAMTKSPRGKNEWEDAVLGIDVGSTSTRMFVRSLNGRREMVIESDQRGNYSRYEPGDFSSSCYPFENGSGKDSYMGNKTDPTRVAVSIKPIFLFLAPIERESLRPLLSEYPYAGELLRRKDSRDNRFKARLSAAVSQFCEFLRKRLVTTCNSERLRVVSVGICTPAHWPVVVEDFMADIFLKKLLKGKDDCLKVSRGDMLFHSETQALAHHVFTHASRELRPPTAMEKDFLLLDFGGQNLNISRYHAQFGGSHEIAFYEIGESRGVVGGSELLDYHIGEFCGRELRNQGEIPTLVDKQDLIDKFRSIKKDLGPGHQIPKNMGELRTEKFTIDLTPEIISDAFFRAMREPLGKCNEALDRCVPANGDRGTQVLVAGGTARSLALRDTLVQICSDYDLAEPIFMEDLSAEIGARYPSLNVAKGAAYANANYGSTKDFLARGAAIGIQMRQAGSTSWDNNAVTLCRTQATGSQALDVQEGDELKLICEPFVKASSQNDTVHYQRAYDLYTLGIFKAGKVRLDTSFSSETSDSGNRTLVLRVRWHPRLRRASRESDWKFGTVRLPLEFNRSSSCMLVARDQVTLNLPHGAMVDPAEAPMGVDISDCGIDHESASEVEGPLQNAGHVVRSSPSHSGRYARGSNLDADGDYQMACLSDEDSEDPDYTPPVRVLQRWRGGR